MKQFLKYILVATLITGTVTSCGLFRKKNQCDTCPHFGKKKH